MPKFGWVRQELCEWFLSARFAIDFEKRDAELRSRGKHKCIGRFPRALFLQKAKALIQVYAEEYLILGKPVDVPDVTTSRWRQFWEAGYGVTLKNVLAGTRSLPGSKASVAKSGG